MIARHDKSTADTCEWAALESLDALPAEERAAYKEHLAGCPACRSDLSAFERVAAELGIAAEPVEPPASLRERLIGRLTSEAENALEKPAEAGQPGPEGVLFNQGGLLISRSNEISWQPAGRPGISTKMLFADPKRHYATQLVRMDPGTTYPSHRHTEVEELFLLEGDLWVEGRKMRPGDYCRGEPDSVHGEVRTDAGAVFLVLASPQDEMLA